MAEHCEKIVGEFSIYTAAALKPKLLEALAAAPALSLDLAGVTEIDSAGIQLLLLLKRETRKSGSELRLTGSNPVVDEALALCNLTDLFNPES